LCDRPRYACMRVSSPRPVALQTFASLAYFFPFQQYSYRIIIVFVYNRIVCVEKCIYVIIRNYIYTNVLDVPYIYICIKKNLIVVVVGRRHVYNMYNDGRRRRQRRPETFVARHGERRNKKLYYTRNSGCRENTKNPFTCGAPSGEESGRSRRYAYNIMIRRVRVCLLPRPRPLTSTVLFLYGI